MGQGSQRDVEELPGYERVSTAVPVKVAPFVVVPEPVEVVPQLSLRTVDVVLPQAYGPADVSRFQMVPGALKAAYLGQRSRGKALYDRGAVL
ncbi:hypothetical protein [Streptomyces sp. MST-110588]|uniref:hypothetical protein n=1 Tax=Streptomyces sp. MST-110588 TaxID=2833628 RepID=UPI001F5CAC09|nr:hypothetical protein [Streptomyces sp. MST-110588]UNO39044.1 hypothetical protein KGS77_04620 [Streptomyces sp. MST-110588]